MVWCFTYFKLRAINENFEGCKWYKEMEGHTLSIYMWCRSKKGSMISWYIFTFYFLFEGWGVEGRGKPSFLAFVFHIKLSESSMNEMFTWDERFTEEKEKERFGGNEMQNHSGFNFSFVEESYFYVSYKIRLIKHLQNVFFVYTFLQDRAKRWKWKNITSDLCGGGLITSMFHIILGYLNTYKQ